MIHDVSRKLGTLGVLRSLLAPPAEGEVRVAKSSDIRPKILYHKELALEEAVAHRFLHVWFQLGRSPTESVFRG
jgi:hypothetical protein